MSDRRINYVSLGCPKALVDSEHIVTALVERGYEIADEAEATDVCVINTCGFIDAAKSESYAAIEAALERGQEVVVTGCLGGDAEALHDRYPQLRHVSGPQEVAPVLDAVQTYVPPARPGAGALPGEARARGGGVRLTPSHYAYLKISEGCNHRCSFCIIPSMRGPLRSRGIEDVYREACGLAERGVQELMLIAQDLSAYGVDLRYAGGECGGRNVPARLDALAELLGDLVPWVRLHYVYPYPSVDALIPLMADGKLVPYLDLPLQHAAPGVLQAMRRPAAAEKTLTRIHRWRERCPDLAIRSTFIVGFPGETDEDVGALLDFLEAAELDRVGCFTYSAVEGAAANALPGHVPERDKLDRQEAVYELQAGVSAARLDRLVGRELRVLVDEAGEDGVVARSMFDAPEIDGVVHVADGVGLREGEFAWVRVTSHDEHDLEARFLGRGVAWR